LRGVAGIYAGRAVNDWPGAFSLVFGRRLRGLLATAH
jgi:hypothetical protein